MSSEETDSNNSAGRRTFDPVGYCIYCGADGKLNQLTDEHIIPYSLAGDLILPKSSCEVCREVTAKFERICARMIFGTARVNLGMPTRRPKERPSRFPMKRDVDGQLVISHEPVATYPVGFAFPMIPGPGILTGEPYHEVFKNLPITVIYLENKEKPLSAFGEGAHISIAIDVNNICRLIAKIALSMAVGHLGYHSIRSIIGDFIRGLDPRNNYFIGAIAAKSMLRKKEGETKWIHQVKLYYHDYKGIKYVKAKVQLFANFGAPIYEVVLGTAR